MFQACLYLQYLVFFSLFVCILFGVVSQQRNKISFLDPYNIQVFQMVLFYICMALFTAIRGEQDFLKRTGNHLYLYEVNSEDPISNSYLPLNKGIPEDNKYSSLKIYEVNKGNQIPQPYSDGFSTISGIEHHQLNYGSPTLTALLLSSILGLPPIKYQGLNHPDQVPINPYVTLLLSQYGRYLPVHALGTKGLYYYAASNNYHNNKPFGSYKVYEDTR